MTHGLKIVAAFAVALCAAGMAPDTFAKPASRQATPAATSQKADKHLWTDCSSELPHKVIAACTQIIEHGRETADGLVRSLINRGRAYRTNGAMEKAFADADKAVTLKPGFAEAYYERGIAYYKLNKEKEALADLDRAIELNPNYALAYDDRGWLRQDKEPFKAEADFDKALQIVDAEIAAGRNLAENYYIRADVYAAKKQYERAIAETTQAIKRKPNFIDGILNRGSIYLRSGDYDRAIADGETVLRMAPDSQQALATRGFGKLALGKNEEALADFERIIALDPHAAMAFAGRAGALKSLGKPDKALADYDHALRLRPDDKFSLVGRGEIHSDREAFEAAHADFNRALLIDPQYVDAYITRAATYNSEKKYDLAIADCDKALQIEPKSASAYFRRGEAFSRKGESARAITEFTKTIELAPKFGTAYIERGALYLQGKEYERAIEDVSAMLKLWPSYARGYYWRGFVLRMTFNQAKDRADRINRAVTDLKEAIRLDSKLLDAYIELSEVYLAKDDKAQALRAINDMVSANSNDPDAFVQRAKFHEARGDRLQAIADYTSALALKPDDMALLKNRARLREAQRDPQGALADLSAIIEKSKGHSKYTAYIDRVEFHKRSKNTRAAIADLTRIVEDKNAGLSVEDMAAAYVYRAKLHYEMKETETSLADYGEAIRIAPHSAEAFRHRAWLLSQNGKYEAALDDLNAVLRIKADDAFALGERGWVYSRLGDHDKAVADLGKAWQASHDADTRAEYNRAVAAKQLKFAELQGGFGAQITPIIGSADVIARITVSPDGTRVAIGGAQRITMWEAASGRLLYAIEADPSPIRGLVFSADGRQLYIATARGTITTLDVAAAKPVRTLQAGDWLTAMALSPDGTQILTGGMAGIELWSIDGQPVPLSGTARSVSAVAFSPDGTRLLAAHDDTKLTLWDKASGQPVRTFEGHTGKVTAVAFARDGSQILSGADDETMRLWDVASGNTVKNLPTASMMPKNFRPLPARIIGLVFSSDGARVLVQKENSSEIWDTATWRKQIRMDEQHAGVFTPDAKMLLTGGSMRAEFHDIVTGRVVKTLGGRFHGVHSLMMSRDGARLFTAGDKLRLWNARTGSLVPSVLPPVGPILYSPDNDALSEPLEKVNSLFLRIYQLARKGNGLPRMVISRDGMSGLTNEGNGKLKVWDVTTGNAGKVIETPAQAITAAVFSPKGDVVAAATQDQYRGNPEAQIGLWKPANGELIKTLPKIDSQITALAVSHDGMFLASGSYDGAVMLWETAQGKRSVTLASAAKPFHQHPAVFDPENPAITSVAFSPDGRWVVAAGGNSGVRLWHARSGDLIKTFGGHVGHVNAVVFSDNGARVIAGGTDGRVSVWDTESGLLLATLYGEESGEWLAITPAGFFAASEKGTEMFGISDGKTLLPLPALSQKLHRPELVAELLKGDPNGKYRDAAQRLNVEAALVAAREKGAH